MAFMKFSKGKAIYSVPNGIGDGSAYFDGVSSFANLSDSNLPMENSARSISLWFYKTNKQNEYTNLVRYGTEYDNYSYSVGINDSGCIETYGCNNTLTYNNELITLGKWYHVVITFNTDYTEQCYLNGVLVGTQTHNGINTHAEVLCLGNWYGVEYFQGNLKDLKIYNRALTKDEVTTLYNKGAVADGLVLNVPLTYGKDNESIFTSKSFVYDYSILTTSSGFDEWGYPIRYDIASECGISYTSIPTKGLLTYVPFDGSSVTPTGEELTSNGIVTYGYDGKIPYVELSGSQIIQSDGANDWCYKGSPFAVSIWVKDVTSSSLQCAFSYGTGQKNKLFSVFVSNNKLCVQGSNDVNNEYHSPNNVLDGSKWTNIVVNQFGTYEDFYINGVKIGTFNWVREITNTDNVFVFGYEKDHSSYYSGKLSTFRYYNRPLTEKEIQQLAKEF